MKKYLLPFILLLCVKGYNQSTQGSICYVTFVNGNIYKDGMTRLIKKDTLSLVSMGKLKFENPSAFLAVYNSEYGSIKINQEKSNHLQKHSESMADYVAELLEIKGLNIPLSSRGDCNCINPQSCFFTDSLINDKVLLIDSLTFQTDASEGNTEGAMYFVQFKTGGKTYSQKLLLQNGKVIISKHNFIYCDTLRFDFATPALIGLLKTVNGIKHSETICKVKFSIVDSDEIYNYYLSLSEAMKGKSSIELYNEFYKSVYSIFGKPDKCRLNRIITHH